MLLRGVRRPVYPVFPSVDFGHGEPENPADRLSASTRQQAHLFATFPTPTAPQATPEEDEVPDPLLREERALGVVLRVEPPR